MAVHLDRVAARSVVQPVDVLGDDARDDARELEARERVVGGVVHDVRSHERLGPALPDARGIAREHVDVPVDHRVEALPEAARRAEVGQPARGRDAGARERHDGRTGLEEARKRERIRIRAGVHARTVPPA